MRSHDTPDLWLREYFQSTSAGAEFLLPWSIDRYVVALAALKALFTPGELKTVIEAHRNLVLDASLLRLEPLLDQIADRCERFGIHTRHGVSPAALEAKCRQLDAGQIAALVLWSSAFWRGQSCSAEAMEKYISAK